MTNSQVKLPQTPAASLGLPLAPSPTAKAGSGAMVRLSKGPDGRQRFVRNNGDLEDGPTGAAMPIATAKASTGSDKHPGRKFGKGRDLFVLLAIAMISAAIGTGLYMQMGLAPGAAAISGIGAFVMLILVHVAARRSGQVKALRRQLQDLERELRATHGGSGQNTTPSQAAGGDQTAKVDPSLEAGFGAGAAGAAGLRLDPADEPLAGSPLSQGAGATRSKDEVLLAGTQLPPAGDGSGGRPESDRYETTSPAPQPVGARHAPPPSRSPPARSGTPPDSDETFVTSMVPVPPPRRSSQGLGPSQANPDQPTPSQPNINQPAPSQSNDSKPEQEHASAAEDLNPGPGPVAAQSASAPAAPAFASASSQSSWPEATSQLMHPPPTTSAEGGGLGQRSAEPHFFDPLHSGEPEHDPQAGSATQSDSAFEPVSLAPIAAPPSQTESVAARSDLATETPPPIASRTAPPPLPESAEPAAAGPALSDAPAAMSAAGGGAMALPRADELAADTRQTDPQDTAATQEPGAMDLAGSVEALRGVAQEMQEMQDMQAARTPGNEHQAVESAAGSDGTPLMDSAAPTDTGAPVVIAATDAGSWDGVGDAATEARRNDEIIDALGAERYALYVTPIHGLDDRKARHLELAVRLKLLSGDLLESADYEDVLAGNGLRPTLDVAKLANSAKLAGRLSGGGKKAAVFSNYAGTSMADDRFLDELADLLNTREHLAGHLVLAFTLRDVREFRELHWDTIDTLHELGFRFSLEQITDLDIDFDDLKVHGFDFIKLDADVFLHGMPLGDTVVPAADLCSHLAEVGQALIVGHIEDEMKLAKILGFGVLLGQGAMFGGARAVTLASLQKTQTEAA